MTPPSATVDITENRHATEHLQCKLGQLHVLFELAGTFGRAQDADEIYRAAVEGLIRGLGADRAAVLIYDPNEAIRFKAWIGLSDEYRAAVDGHTLWRWGARNAELMTCADV